MIAVGVGLRHRAGPAHGKASRVRARGFPGWRSGLESGLCWVLAGHFRLHPEPSGCAHSVQICTAHTDTKI